MKKQPHNRKLVLSKETLTTLYDVSAGSVYERTVIIIEPSDQCISNACTPVIS